MKATRHAGVLRHSYCNMKLTGLTVRINTADEPELEKLQGIGPRLAERIVLHRQAEGDFSHALELSRVNGISPQLAQLLSSNIDCARPEETPLKSPWLLPGLIVAAAFLVVLLIPLISEILNQLDKLDGSAVATLSLIINIAALALACGSMALAFSWGTVAYFPASNRWMVTASLIMTTVALLVLLSACLLGFWIMPNSAVMLSSRMVPLSLTVVFIIYILYGPQLFCLTTRSPQRLVTAAGIFDLSLLPLALVVLALCLVKPGDQVIFNLFLIWAGTIFAVQGLVLARRGSCFQESLEALIPQIDAEELHMSIDLIDSSGKQVRARIGNVLVAVGGIVLLTAGWQLLGTLLATLLATT
jgi:hypothetical protein